MITALPQVLGYLERNARDPSAENEPITSVPTQREGDDDDEFVDSAISWGTGSAEGTDETWKKVNDDQKPAIDVFDPKMLDMQRKQTRMWTQFDETGEAVDSDAEGEEGPKADEETKTNTEVDSV